VQLAPIVVSLTSTAPSLARSSGADGSSFHAPTSNGMLLVLDPAICQSQERVPGRLPLWLELDECVPGAGSSDPMPVTPSPGEPTLIRWLRANFRSAGAVATSPPAELRSASQMPPYAVGVLASSFHTAPA